jgi:hypothetical protein
MRPILGFEPASAKRHFPEKSRSGTQSARTAALPRSGNAIEITIDLSNGT